MAIIANRNFPARRGSTAFELGEMPEALTEDTTGFSFTPADVDPTRVGPQGPQGEPGEAAGGIGGGVHPTIVPFFWVQERLRIPVGANKFG